MSNKIAVLRVPRDYYLLSGDDAAKVAQILANAQPLTNTYGEGCGFKKAEPDTYSRLEVVYLSTLALTELELASD